MTTFDSARTFSWKKAVVLSVCAGLLTAVLSIIVQTHTTFASSLLTATHLETDLDVSTQTPPVSSTEPTGNGSSFEVPGQPVRLVIPAIGVDAHIESVGLSWRGTGDMGVPTNFTNVAWYNGGPLPGMPGSAVIDGHLDGKNVKEAVFYNLDKLQTGDMVDVIDAKGNTLQFRVTGSKVYGYDATTTEVFSGDASTARLNLITCAGQWIKSEKLYGERLVVFTELVTAI